ncbi:MAG: amidohydrolase family protein [Pyrinomonadaceae bacterium]|nr:amidohydrolase family protein [Pyrinomonadaceae bacterium]
MRAVLPFIVFLAATSLYAQNPASPTDSGKRPARVLIKSAMVINGNGKPAAGPYDISVVDDRIERISRSIKAKGGDVVIDASGKYVMPGLINLHGHTQDGRGGVPQPVEYCMKLWLASGITTVRDLGAGPKTLKWREQSANNEIPSQKIYAYGVFTRSPNPQTAEAARQRVRDLKSEGYDGIKLFGVDRDIMAAMMDEAKNQGMRVAHHTAVEETNAWDDVKFGTTTIEHWYGIPEAAMANQRQTYPADYNYNDEVDRFRYAGRIWREAEPKRLMKLFDAMVKNNVAWNPTLSIYEASRDLQRAQNQPYFKDYLHPTVEEFFKPNPKNHGSYFIGWTSTDEAYWSENFRIWMRALREFEKRGGIIGAGEDAGFIYRLYGFGMVRELELHQEAGFTPLQVIRHATSNNARIMGIGQETGRIRQGYKANLIVVNGNPLEDFKLLYPSGTDGVKDGKVVRTGGVEWTIKDGIPFHGPTLAKEVRDMVRDAKKARAARP